MYHLKIYKSKLFIREIIILVNTTKLFLLFVLRFLQCDQSKRS